MKKKDNKLEELEESKEISKVNLRVRELINHYADGNELEFSSLIKISQPRINRMFRPPYPMLSFSILEAIKTNIPEVNMDWLVTGEGSRTDGKKLNLKEVKREYEDQILQLKERNDFLLEKISLLEEIINLKKKLEQQER